MVDIQERRSVSTSSSSTSSSSSLTAAQPKGNSLPIDAESWMIAEERAHEILTTIQPAIVSDRSRNEIIDYVQTLIKSHDGIEVRNSTTLSGLKLSVLLIFKWKFVSTHMGLFIWFSVTKNLSP